METKWPDGNLQLTFARLLQKNLILCGFVSVSCEYNDLAGFLTKVLRVKLQCSIKKKSPTLFYTKVE